MPREDDDRDRRDDYDDRPRRKSSSSGLVIGLVGGGIALVFFCIIGAALLMLPAISKVREAASRVNDQNNMKQISLSFHNQQDNQGSMTAVARDRNGTVGPGLSWRVGLLPYMEQANLHSSFDYKQAWDSPRNQPFSNVTIPQYRTPFDDGPGTSTPYRVFVGGGALFDAVDKPSKMTSVTDGTANTILVMHATEQVPWAQPKELPYSPTAPLPAFGHKAQPNGTNVAMVDGSVRFLSKSTSETVIRGLITRAGGEQLPLDW